MSFPEPKPFYSTRPLSWQLIRMNKDLLKKRRAMYEEHRDRALDRAAELQARIDEINAQLDRHKEKK